MIHNDPTGDLYTIMDKSGLSGAHLLNSSKSMERIVTEIRVRMVKDLKDYIERRERERTQI